MNSDRIAVSRRLRVLVLLCRSVSRCSRNAVISSASRSAQSRADGVLPVRLLGEGEQQLERIAVRGDGARG